MIGFFPCLLAACYLPTLQYYLLLNDERTDLRTAKRMSGGVRAGWILLNTQGMDDGVDFISFHDTLSTFLRVFNECCLLATLQCGLLVCFGLSLLEVWKDE